MEEREETVILRGRPLGACHRMLSHAYSRGAGGVREPRPVPDVRLLRRSGCDFI